MSRRWPRLIVFDKQLARNCICTILPHSRMNISVELFPPVNVPLLDLCLCVSYVIITLIIENLIMCLRDRERLKYIEFRCLYVYMYYNYSGF